MKKRLLASLLSLCLLVGLFPTAALAAEDTADEAQATACTATVGCTLVAGHDGECILPDEPETREGDTNSYYEFEDVYGIDEDTVAISPIQERINALPSAEALSEMDAEEQAEVYAEVCAIYDAIDELSDEEADALDVSALEEAAAFFTRQIMPLDADPMSGSCGAPTTEDGEATDAVKWSFDSTTGTLTISGQGAMADYSVDTNNDSRPWAAYQEKVKQVTIGNGVTKIGDYAFYMFSNLEDVKFEGASLSSIGERAFATYDHNITSFAIPDSVTEIGEWAFAMYSVEELTLPTSITSIGNCAFADCISLKLFKMGSADGYTVTDGVLFKGESDQKTLVAYPAGNERASYSVPDGTTIIGTYAFVSASNLTSITLPASVTTLEAKAFQGTGLTEFSIPSSVTSIGTELLRNCNSLQYLYFDTAAWPTNTGGTIYTILENAGSSAENGLVVVFGDNVTTIPTNFGYYTNTSNNPKITAITYKAGTSIGERAFYNCKDLKTILVRGSSSNTSETIGNNAFSNVAAKIYAPSENSGLPTGLTQKTYPVAEQAAIEAGSTIALDVLDDLAVFGTISYKAEGYSGSDFSINGNEVTLSTATSEAQISIDISLKLKDLDASISLGTVTVKFAGEKQTVTGTSGSWSYSYTYYKNVPEDGVLSLTGYTGSDSAIKLPETLSITIDNTTYDNVDVAAVAGSFSGGNVNTIVVPNQIREIANGAFSSFTGQIFFLPGSVCTGVGTNAFGSAQVYCDSALASVLGDSATVCDVIADVSDSEGNGLVIGYLTDGKLTLTGSGIMQNISAWNAAPWYSNRAKVVSAEVEDGVTYVGSYFLNGCTNAKILTIGKDVKSSALNAFASPTFDVVYVNSSYSDSTANYNARYLADLKASTVVFGSEVTSIPAYLLNDNKVVKKIVILGSNTTVGSNNCQTNTVQTDIYVKNGTISFAENVKTNNVIYIVGEGAGVYEAGGTTSFEAVYKPGYEATWYEYNSSTTDYSSENKVESAVAGETYIAVWKKGSVTLQSDASEDTATYDPAGGITLSLTSSSSAWTYIWYKKAADGGSGTVVGGGSTLTLKNVADSGTYYVQVLGNSDEGYWTSNEVTITINAADVTNTAKSDETCVYGETYDVSNLFALDTNAGAATYDIVTGDQGGTGTAMLDEDGKTLTVTKAGTIVVKLTTTASSDGNYAADSTGVTATLTVKKARPNLAITPSSATLSGSGTVTLTVSGLPDGASAAPTCEGVTVTADPDGTYSVSLPNETKKYTFTVSYAGDGNHEAATATCTVSVTSKSGSSEDTKVEVSGLAAVPEGLSEKYESVDELTTALKTEITQINSAVPASNIAVYDVKLMVTTDSGKTWEVATKDNFPKNGQLTITLPYPEGTNSNYKFTVVHMFTTSDFGKTPGDTETPNVTNTSSGLQFSVTGLSPISVGWTAPASNTGGGGGGSSSSSYTVTVDSAKNGTVKADRTSASKGTTVTLTVTPKDGYELDSLTVTDKNGDTVKLTRKSDTQYTFTMPASKVTVEASFTKIAEQPKVSFVDVPTSAYYYDAVAWAVENGVTAGTSATTFSPDASCTRAQAVTFLWRAAGSPAPKSSVNPFADVPASAYYYDAVLWAVEQGITAGTSATTFSPDATCTRAQIVTFLYRADGTATTSNKPFVDVADSAYYVDAVKWAVAGGVTAGTSATTFSPDASCTRAQIVTFLYRAYA